MSIPLLEYAPSTQNSRVKGYDLANEDRPRTFSTDTCLSDGDMTILIEAAYRQLFFHAFAHDRETFLESQLRNGQITVRDFIRGLCLSNTFTKSFYNLNSNYRFVQQCVQRLLGREVYSEREKIAWSIVVATKGRAGFINDLLNSEEYLENFGDTIVPFQRRRVLPSGATEVPFNIQSPRYDEYYRGKLGFPQFIPSLAVKRFVPQEQQPKEGDPSAYLDMVKSLGRLGGTPSTVAVGGLDYNSKVPYRQVGG